MRDTSATTQGGRSVVAWPGISRTKTRIEYSSSSSSTSTREARASWGRRRGARRRKIRDRRQEHRCDVFPSPSRSNTRCRGRDARDTRAGVFPDSEGRLTWGVQTRPGARGVARVPSGCSCLNVERADIFVVDRREGERWFLTGLLLRARRYDTSPGLLDQTKDGEKEIIFGVWRENHEDFRAKLDLPKEIATPTVGWCTTRL